MLCHIMYNVWRPVVRTLFQSWPLPTCWGTAGVVAGSQGKLPSSPLRGSLLCLIIALPSCLLWNWIVSYTSIPWPACGGMYLGCLFRSRLQSRQCPNGYRPAIMHTHQHLGWPVRTVYERSALKHVLTRSDCMCHRDQAGEVGSTARTARTNRARESF